MSNRETTTRCEERPRKHPGYYLKKELEAKNTLPKDFAKLSGINQSLVSRIISEERPISVAIAFKIGKVLGTSPELWLTFQLAYDVWEYKQKKQINTIMNMKNFKQPFYSYITVYGIGNQIEVPEKDENLFGFLYETPQELINHFKSHIDFYLNTYNSTYYIVELKIKLFFVYDEMQNQIVEHDTPLYEVVERYNIHSFKEAYKEELY